MQNNETIMTSVELKQLTNKQLHNKMVSTSQKERELTAQMVSMIGEAAKRKFYLDLNFATLFDYLTLGLSYSPASAMRRISAAKITEEVPEVKAKILDGSLTLSNLAQAEKFFRNEQKNDHHLNLDEKKIILHQLENKSSREAEKTLLQMSSCPEQLKPEKIKPISPEFTQITLNADSQFMELLEEARGLLGHQMPGATIAEILAEMMRVGIGELNRKKFKLKTTAELSNKAEPKKVEIAGVGVSDAGIKATSSVSANPEYICNEVKRVVFLRDQGRCVVPNLRTGKPCGSRLNLQYDHYPIPRAQGGPSTASNIRLSCFQCNKLHAVQVYGRIHILKKIGSTRNKF